MCESVTLFLSLLLGSGQGLPMPKDDATNNRDLPIRQLIDWLPDNTETLLVSRGPFSLQREQLQSGSAIELSQQLERWSYSPLLTIRKGALLAELDGVTVSHAVEGARHFKSAAGLGPWPYEGCHILVFSQDPREKAARFIRALKVIASKQRQVHGIHVLEVDEKIRSASWKYAIAMPRDNMLLLATDSGYLDEILQRMQQKKNSKIAFPATLPEWRYVDQKNRFWGLRHYRKRQDEEELIDSPLSSDPLASGLVFSFAPLRNEAARPRVTYLSTNKNGIEIATKAWTYFDQITWRPSVQVRQSGVIEITTELMGRQMTEYMFLLLFHLGHGVNS